jgi:hypothetical protein
MTDTYDETHEALATGEGMRERAEPQTGFGGGSRGSDHGEGSAPRCADAAGEARGIIPRY